MSMRPLSPAALSRFENCPRRFLLQDVERLHGQQEASVSLGMGNAAHDALCRLFRKPPGERTADALGNALRFCWRKHCPRSLFTSREEEAVYGLALHSGSRPSSLQTGAFRTSSGLVVLIGTTGFEPATSASQRRRSTRLSYVP